MWETYDHSFAVLMTPQFESHSPGTLKFLPVAYEAPLLSMLPLKASPLLPISFSDLLAAQAVCASPTGTCSLTFADTVPFP